MLTAEHQLWVFHSQHSRTSSTDLTLGLRSSHRSQVPTRGSPLSITFDSRPAVLRSPRHVDVPVCHAPHVVLLLSGRVRGQVSVRVMEVCSCGCRAHGAHTHTHMHHHAPILQSGVCNATSEVWGYVLSNHQTMSLDGQDFWRCWHNLAHASWKAKTILKYLQVTRRGMELQ